MRQKTFTPEQIVALVRKGGRQAAGRGGAKASMAGGIFPDLMSGCLQEWLMPPGH